MNGYVVVANPAAGGGRARSLLPVAVAGLRAGGTAVEVVESRSIEHAVETASAAARDGAVVVALGGDGMVGALAGAVATADGVLGVVPAGRGNDFARGLGVPREPRAAAAALLGGVERRVDVGEVAGRAFVGVASVGFDSEANRVANASRLVRGRLVYPYATVRTLVSWRPAGFRVTVDGVRHDYTGYMVSIGNGRSYGGGMLVAPNADLADGLLDVIMTARASKARFLLTAPKVFSGRHLAEPMVSEARGREVRVEADRPLLVYADGEPVGGLPVTLTVRPGALRVLAPAT